MRAGDKCIAVYIYDFIPESVKGCDRQDFRLELPPVDSPFMRLENSFETCLQPLEKSHAVFGLPVQYQMNMIAHQFECDDPDLFKQYCRNSQSCHRNLEIFLGTQEVFHNPAICI